MLNIFLNVLRGSVTAAFVAFIIIIARLLLKGAPRWITCVLWGILALRLICPVLPESSLSIVPSFKSEEEVVYYSEEITVLNQPLESANSSQLPQTSELVSLKYFPVNSDTLKPVASYYEPALIYIWSIGTAIMLSYGVLSYTRFRLRFRDSVLLCDNILQSEKVTSPFVLGVLKPRIYIPFNLDNKTKKQVILHEQAHIRRFDHIWKLLGFVLLCLHWFNPLMWVSYTLFCRDVEVACDEKVIKNYSTKKKQTYAMALLKCRNSSRLLYTAPLAFGEIGVDVRIKKTIKYKRPAAVVAVFGVIFTLALSVCLLTNPVSALPDVTFGKEYVSDIEVKDESFAVEQAVTTVPVTEEPTEPLPETTTEPEAVPTEPITENYVADSFTEDYDYEEESYDYDSNFSADFVMKPLPEIEPITLAPSGTYKTIDVSGYNNTGYRGPYYGPFDPTKPIRWDNGYTSDSPGYINTMDVFNGPYSINKRLNPHLY